MPAEWRDLHLRRRVLLLIEISAKRMSNGLDAHYSLSFVLMEAQGLQ